jgi:hypothetical protein
MFEPDRPAGRHHAKPNHLCFGTAMGDERSSQEDEGTEPEDDSVGESPVDAGLSKQYKSDPSIQNYVDLRRQHPKAQIEVAVIGGIDSIFFMEPELKKYGFDPFLVVCASDADPIAIAELSLQIMEDLVQAAALKSAGATQLSSRQIILPDKLVDWMITTMLDALSWNDSLHIPRELIVLIRERLGGASSEYEEGRRTAKMRSDAIRYGSQIRARGEKPSFNGIAKMMGVAASTVKRWFPEGDFTEEVERQYRHYADAGMFDENGNLTPRETWNFSSRNRKWR